MTDTLQISISSEIAATNCKNPFYAYTVCWFSLLSCDLRQPHNQKSQWLCMILTIYGVGYVRTTYPCISPEAALPNVEILKHFFLAIQKLISRWIVTVKAHQGANSHMLYLKTRSCSKQIRESLDRQHDKLVLCVES